MLTMDERNQLFLAAHPDIRRKIRAEYRKAHPPVIVMAIKPKYAKAIYEGRKNWEFRKAPPPIYKEIYIYESAPVSRITGRVIFCASVTGVWIDVWEMVKTNQCFTRNLPGISFDLVLYSTPPVTLIDPIRYVKRKYGAKTYLMLKDIFPQNAVDIGMMKKSGPMGIIYKNFRRKEKKLYAISDRIGCMSRANIDYVLQHNPEVDPGKVELCPNSIEVMDMSVDAAVRKEIREKYEIPLDKKVFIYGGNLGKPQGIDFVLRCLEKLTAHDNAYFLIVGDGTEFKKLEAWFREHKPGNMKLLKKIVKADYDRLAAACDVGLIFLDHRFTIPNFPSRLLSHMQAKQPVLACTDPNTDVGQVITGGGFGWWCESNDPDGFASKVNEACKADLTPMGEKGFAYLEDHYSVAKTSEQILKGLN